MKLNGRSLGLLAMAAAYALHLPLLAWKGPTILPSQAGFEAFATSMEFEVYTRGALNLLVWAIFGHIALHHTLRSRASFYGNAFGIASLAVALPVLGVMGWAWPHMDAPAAQAALDAAQTWFIFSMGFWALSVVLLAWALREAGHNSWILWLGGMAICFPMFWPVAMVGAACAGAAAIWIWYQPPKQNANDDVQQS